MNAISAPASSAAFSRFTPSSNACLPAVAPPKMVAWRASVRAMMTKSGSRRASTALRIRSRYSSIFTTSLPVNWPQRLGKTWETITSANFFQYFRVFEAATFANINSFLSHLILDMTCSNTSLLVQSDSPSNIQRPSVSSIRIGENRNVCLRGNHPTHTRNLRLRNDGEIRMTTD